VADPDRLTDEQTARIRGELETWREATEAAVGKFRTEVLPTGRILVVPTEILDEPPHVAYMSDDGPEARLVIDDYVPELAVPGLNPEFPSDAQPGDNKT
jgi:hypothetical protein